MHHRKSSKSSLPHELRTAAEPRQNKLYTVHLSHIEQVNPTVRLLRLTLPTGTTTDVISEEDEDPNAQHQEPFAFLPGQWLDVHIPSIPQAGGFTITSTPADAQPLPSPDPTLVQTGSDQLTEQSEDLGVPSPDANGRPPYVELAVQESPSNPPAAWLWRPRDEILGKELSIRVGGSFVWPPAAVPVEQIRKVVFVAGGVGINPLISMLSHITQRKISEAPTSSSLPLRDTTRHSPLSIRFLYSTRLPGSPTSGGKHEAISAAALQQILFLSRLCNIIKHSSSPSSSSSSSSQPSNLSISLDLFLTNLSPSAVDRAAKLLGTGGVPEDESRIRVHARRISAEDLRDAATGTPTEGTVCYICGPPPMTDESVRVVGTLIGQDRVLYEKWW